MLLSSSHFIASSISVYHNAVKSLIFSTADLLLATAVYMFFSLVAAKTNLFASYLMFAEDYIQKALFVFSRGFSVNSVLVLCFTLLYTAARLYGTMLWGLDAPGYIMQAGNASASTLDGSLLQVPAYIVSVDAEQNSLGALRKDLPRLIGANLFKPNVNFTLTSAVQRGLGEVVPPTRSDVGGRIWLDTAGLSVSPDTNVMTSYSTDEVGNMIPLGCSPQVLAEHSKFWNCTFNNTFVQPLLTSIIGRPEVHWDDASDQLTDSRYISPDRKKNIWAAFGQGGGTSIMKQMFTITKGTRRHTFIQTTFRGTMVSNPAVPFSELEVKDFVRRTWSTNSAEQQAPLVDRLYNSIINAQSQDKSFMFGLNDATDRTTTQVTWEYLTPETDGVPIFSVIRISSTNITLIRSETVGVAPTPFETCDNSFQNLAYGGRVADTDCTSARTGSPPLFMGQVDTSAFLILYGLGDGRSNISSKALNEGVYEWSIENSNLMDDLLVSRGFIVSIDSSLVKLEVSTLRPAISYLQMFLCLLAAVLALVTWTCLHLLASSHWSNSLLSNLLAATGGVDDGKTHTPGYVRIVPNIKLQMMTSTAAIVIDEAQVTLDRKPSQSGGLETKGQQVFVFEHPVETRYERQSFLSDYRVKG